MRPSVLGVWSADNVHYRYSLFLLRYSRAITSPSVIGGDMRRIILSLILIGLSSCAPSLAPSVETMDEDGSTPALDVMAQSETPERPEIPETPVSPKPVSYTHLTLPTKA